MCGYVRLSVRESASVRLRVRFHLSIYSMHERRIMKLMGSAEGQGLAHGSISSVHAHGVNNTQEGTCVEC